MILDLFAGPGGWSEGLRSIGLSDVGIEWDAAACATRAAAGHATIRADVAQYPTEPFAGKVSGLIASPPCQDFSMAGKRAGRTGDKGQLIDEVPRWVDALRPEWVACEQVPPALEVWEEFAELFRSWGYSAWCGILNAADFGVPQTRRRAILVASRVGAALPPEPTHDREPVASLFGPERQPWVSMAEALGWDDGRLLNKWQGEGMVERYGERPDWAMDEPAFSITGAATRTMRWLNPGATDTQPNRRLYGPEEPAPTVAFGHDAANWKWVVRTGANSMKHNRVTADIVPYERPVSEPAPTVDTKAGSAWTFHMPATTIAGDPRITARCHHDEGSQGSNAKTTEQVRAGDYEGTEPVKLTIGEALVLQSFDPDYPVTGTKTKQFEQIGNAVPPVLAAAVISALVPETARSAA